MTELALNILDIANNSTRAKAKNVFVKVGISTQKDMLTININDDGCGMSPEFLQSVTDPFSTTRTTRKVGMGLPLFKMQTQMAEGDLLIESEVNVGTKVTAFFKLSHIDRPPLGDIAFSIITLVGGAKDTEITFEYALDSENYIFSTKEVKEILAQDDLTDVTILNYLSEMINENIININKGAII